MVNDFFLLIVALIYRIHLGSKFNDYFDSHKDIVYTASYKFNQMRLSPDFYYKYEPSDFSSYDYGWALKNNILCKIHKRLLD